MPRGDAYHVRGVKPLRDKLLDFCHRPVGGHGFGSGGGGARIRSWSPSARPVPRWEEPGASLRDVMPRGWKGAALAAFGDIVVFFNVAGAMVGEEPLEERSEGVKLGESTFRRRLLSTIECMSMERITPQIPGLDGLGDSLVHLIGGVGSIRVMVVNAT